MIREYKMPHSVYTIVYNDSDYTFKVLQNGIDVTELVNNNFAIDLVMEVLQNYEIMSREG